jgi:hypothetical protein
MLRIMGSEKHVRQRQWFVLNQYPEIFLERVRAIAASLIPVNRSLTVATILPDCFILVEVIPLCCVNIRGLNTK